MASGTITLSRSGSGKMDGRITWSSTSNGTEANTSSVTAKVQIKRPAGYTTTGTWKGSLKVGGSTKTIEWYGSISSSWVTVATLTRTVSHNSDGSGTCYIYGKVNGPSGTSMEGTYVSKSSTVTLDKIPRQAVMTSATDFNDEENPVITYNNPLGAAVPSLQVGISLDSTNDCKIAYRDVNKTAGIDTLILTEDERDELRAAVTGSNTRTVWIYLRTRIGETYYYSPMSKVLTIKNPKPIISPDIKDTNRKTIELTGNDRTLIKYYSDAEIIIGASAVKQATLESQKVTCGSKSLTANGTIEGVESNSFVFTATDNRGNNTNQPVTTPFVDYVKLTCNLENNMPDTSGNMEVKVTGNYFNGSFGSKSNSLDVYYHYKTPGGSYSDWVAMTVTKSGNSYSATANVTGLDYQAAYVVQAYARDELSGDVPSLENTVRSTPVFDWGENDFKFNVPTFVGEREILKRCIVGQNSSSDTNPWYKYASVTASAINEDMRISFKVTYSYGSNTRFGTLNAMVRTENASGANAFQRLEFESDTGLDSSNFVMTYSSTGIGGVYELWVKLTAYRFCMFEVLSESSRTAYTHNWILYNQISAGHAAEPTSGYKQVTATKPYLLNAYPVGSYYISANDTSPASLFGGTWHRIESRFLWAAPSTSTLGSTAGEMTHTLTVAEMPSHSHKMIRPKWYAGDGNGTISDKHSDSTVYAYTSGTSVQYITKDTGNMDIRPAGSGAAHNNMPPYVNVAIWRREA